MFDRDELKEGVGGCFFKVAGDITVQELLQLDGVFGWCFFTIYEMVQYNRLVLCLFLLVFPQTRK